MNAHPLIRTIYLYLFALIGLALIAIGGVRLIGLGLKTYIFTQADVYYEYPMAKPIPAPGTEGNKEVSQPSQQEIQDFQNKQRTSQRQRDAAEALAMLIIGVPLYLYHWTVIKKDKKNG